MCRGCGGDPGVRRTVALYCKVYRGPEPAASAFARCRWGKRWFRARARPAIVHFGKGNLMRSRIWLGILIGSTIGGLIPELWGDDWLSYASVLLSGIGAFA